MKVYHGSKTGLLGAIAPRSRAVWNYLTGESSKEIYAQCDENELLASYGFHTEANELAVEDIKAAKRLRQ